MQTVSDIISLNGGPTKLAEALGVPLGTVSAWASRNSIPANKVIDVERITGVSRHVLRPDVFGQPAPTPQVDKECAA